MLEFEVALGKQSLEPLLARCADPASAFPEGHRVRDRGWGLNKMDHLVCDDIIDARGRRADQIRIEQKFYPHG